jgi:hypothetical protein
VICLHDGKKGRKKHRRRTKRKRANMIESVLDFFVAMNSIYF